MRDALPDIHSDAPFGAGRALSLAARLFARHFFTFVGITLVLQLPLIVWGYSVYSDPLSLALDDSIESYTKLADIIEGVLSSLGTAVIAVIAFRSLSAETTSLTSALSQAGKKLPTLLGAAFLIGLAIGLGTMLLIVPGLIFATRLSVAIPAVVCEDFGAVDALTRSNELVTGYGWPVFGVIVVSALPVIMFVIMTGENTRLNHMEYFGILMTIQVLTQAFTGAAAAAVYTELRRVKEGVESSALLDVFS